VWYQNLVEAQRIGNSPKGNKADDRTTRIHIIRALFAEVLDKAIDHQILVRQMLSNAFELKFDGNAPQAACHRLQIQRAEYGKSSWWHCSRNSAGISYAFCGLQDRGTAHGSL
jgi:hypothetical protein